MKNRLYLVTYPMLERGHKAKDRRLRHHDISSWRAKDDCATGQPYFYYTI